MGDTAVLVGSSGLFGFDTSVPALTEDIDVAIPEVVVAEHGPAIVESLVQQGFEHEHGTASFVDTDGVTFDLLGYGDPGAGDHIGGAGALRVMVFEDISRIVGEMRATTALAHGGRAMTPAGFVVSKLLTERAHKGTKDKLQALLVLAERSNDERFAAEVADLLRGVDPVRIEDLSASAQDACIALGRDPRFSDAGAEGYLPEIERVEAGFGSRPFWRKSMVERKRRLTADERLAELRRDQARIRRDRMLRELAGPRWGRMVRVTPAFFERAGTINTHVLRAERARVIEALREDAVFALDTAMRIAHGSGLLASGDIQAYLTAREPLARLASSGLIVSDPHSDRVLIRPWAGPDRLLACIVGEPPPHHVVEGGFRVVTDERLRQELIGAVGARVDLFALLDRADEAASFRAGG